MAICSQGGLQGPLSLAKLSSTDHLNRPVVQLYKSNVASLKDGQFLVRTTAARLSKKDYYAYVPYRNAELPASEGGRECDHMLLKVTGLYAWCERDHADGIKVYRFAVGQMSALTPKGQSDYGHVTEYWDGSNGHMARKPTLLAKPARPRPYLYGVWLDQIDCSLVSTANERYFIPTLKLAHFG